MKGKLFDIQILRFLAAFLVVISHLMKEMNGGLYQTENYFSITLIGQFGVDLFFVISGFIMMYVSKNSISGVVSSVDFLIKRICRVVPLYWLFTLITLIITLVIPEAKNNNSLDLNYLISSLLFIPYERVDGNVTPFFGLGWTLNYEMFFYIIFSCVLVFKKEIRAVLFTTVLLTLVAIGYFFDINSVVITYLTHSVILEFLFGYLLAKLYISEFKISYFKSLLLIAIGFVSIYFSTFIDVIPSTLNIRGVYWGIPAAFIFAGVVLCEGGFFRFIPSPLYNILTRLGDGSFSLYLGHMFVVRALTMTLPLFVSGIFYDVIYFILAIVICFIMSDVMYRYFEVPSNRLALKLFGR